MSGSRTPPLFSYLWEYSAQVNGAIVQDTNADRGISTIGGGTVVPIFQGIDRHHMGSGINDPVFTDTGTLVQVEFDQAVILSGAR